MPAARDKKKIYLAGEKGDAAFHLRVLHYTSDHAVFPAAVNNTGNKYAENVEVEIEFPYQNCKILSIFHSDEDLIGEQSWGEGDYRYRVKYPKIRENKEINLVLIVENTNFDINKTQIIKPDYRGVWSDSDGQIDIIVY